MGSDLADARPAGQWTWAHRLADHGPNAGTELITGEELLDGAPRTRRARDRARDEHSGAPELEGPSDIVSVVHPGTAEDPCRRRNGTDRLHGRRNKFGSRGGNGDRKSVV